MSPNKPSEQEQEYFHRLEQERLAKRRAEAAEREAAAERERLKKLTHMRCPKCAASLETVTYRGVEIDRCPECRGVWFDAGEARRVLEGEKKAESGMFQEFLGGLFGGKKQGESPL